MENQLIDAIKKKEVKKIRKLLIANPSDVEKLDACKLIREVYDNVVGFNNVREPIIIKILQAFFTRGLNVDFNDQEDCTILYIPLKYHMKTVFDWFIRGRIDLHVRDNFENSLLHIYILTVYEVLTKSEYPIIKSKRRGKRRDERADYLEESTEFIEWLIKKKLDVDCTNKNGDTALHMAAGLGLLHLMPILLVYTKDVTIVNNFKLTALQVFTNSFKGPWIEHGEYLGFPHAPGNPIYIGNSDYVQKIYKKFMKKGFSLDVVDDTGLTPVHYLLRQAHHNNSCLQFVDLCTSMLKELKDHINACDEYGETLLDIIVTSPRERWGRYYYNGLEATYCKDLACILMSKGADMYKVNKSGMSPLFAAVVRHKMHHLKAFIDCGANLHRLYGAGRNLLHFLINPKYSEIIRLGVVDNNCFHATLNLLLRDGCDVNAKDIEGKTPLYEAVLRQDYRTVEKLVRFGAEIDGNIFKLSLTPLLCQFFKEHLTKLNIVKMPIDEMGQCFVKYYCASVDTYKCYTELGSLDDYKITHFVSLNDLFSMDQNTLCNYVNIRKLKEFINSAQTQLEFPMYHIVISSLYYKAVERSKLLEPAKQAWWELTDIALPNDCIYKILSNLSNTNLRLMAEEVLHSIHEARRLDKCKKLADDYDLYRDGSWKIEEWVNVNVEDDYRDGIIVTE